MLGSVNILFKIRNQIEKDMKLYSNFYWNFNYDIIKGELIINPLEYYTYDKVIFMGDILIKHCGMCDYLSDLYNKYPININFTPNQGCIITIDETRLRKK